MRKITEIAIKELRHRAFDPFWRLITPLRLAATGLISGYGGVDLPLYRQIATYPLHATRIGRRKPTAISLYT